jgi:hypothetical protein
MARIAYLRTLQDGWEEGHQATDPGAADAAEQIALRVGPELLFAVPFDGSIVLHRWMPELHPYYEGRSVETLPGNLMNLVADYPFEEGSDENYELPLDIERATRWLLHDPRNGRMEP